jgi:hypothetical protein
MLSIAVSIGLLLIAAAISIALQLWLQNSYLIFLVQCVLFMGLYQFAGNEFWCIGGEKSHPEFTLGFL